ncbi:uncharacterized protein LOC143299127, partial [Babylonia areolata]|uniref:uncharacterized protein LOC143299127 n=1 Tax=Babylonia areolata TaxID=304850 RepID=UPI003FD5CC9D
MWKGVCCVEGCSAWRDCLLADGVGEQKLELFGEMCTVWPSKLSAAIGRSVVRSFGKDRSSSNNSASTPTTPLPLNNSLTPTPHPSAVTMSGGKKDGGGGVTSAAQRDLLTEARSFTSGLNHVLLLKTRDQQTRHLLEKAQVLLEALIAENSRLQQGGQGGRGQGAGGRAGQTTPARQSRTATGS